MFEFEVILFVGILFVVALTLFKSIVIVPHQLAYVVERLGRYRITLNSGLNFIIPFIDQVAYRHSLKEIPLDVKSQVCITKDNIQLMVDGIIYFQVTDAKAASYGTSDYVVAITQLAQTTLRSAIGRLELDATLEERDGINQTVIAALDAAASNWGVRVLRYEIKDLTPPEHILKAMQAQLTAERHKRALIAESEGKRAERINLAEGVREASIKESEGKAQAEVNASEAAKTAQINKAMAEAESVRLLAEAKANAILRVAEALDKNGKDAAVLELAEKYIEGFAQIAKEGNTIVIPSNVADIGGLMASGMSVLQAVQNNNQQNNNQQNKP